MKYYSAFRIMIANPLQTGDLLFTKPGQSHDLD